MLTMLAFFDSPGTLLALIVTGIGFVIGIGMIKWLLSMYRKVDQGTALIINNLKSEPDVTFTGGMVLPIVHRAEVMDISLKTIEIDRRGHEGLICQDNIRADIKVTFFVRVNKTKEDVLHVAQTIGCARASKQETLNELFNAKFSEALKTVGKQMDFVELYQEREKFKNRIIETIGQDLSGYKLEDAAIDYLEQTPLENLNENNILDAAGIKKITELTSIERIKANEIRRHQDKVMTQQNVDAREKILELERQQAEAEIKQKKEIEVIRSTQEAEAKITSAEQFNRSEQARLKAEEEVQIANENKERQVQVAAKGREKAVLVEQERVLKAQSLEAIERERETELQRIGKEKSLEVERKNIQDVIRARVAVEKTVAEEEERIKDARAFFTADRAKKVAITAAEQHAQENLVKDIKAAEAKETAAKHLAAQELTMAQAEFRKAEQIAAGKMKLAEGIRAERAALGLAEVQVREANAAAIEKLGTAEAMALRLKLEAEADGAARMGDAQALAVREKMLAEAKGLAEKAEAMKALDESTRGHEEYRLNLEKEKAIDLAEIEARKAIVQEQAKAMAEAFKSAKIEIVGGDGAFFEKYIQAATGGKALDAFVDRSKVVQKLGKDYLNGDASLMQDIKEILTKANIGTEDLKNLSTSALLAKLAAGDDDGGMEKVLRKLLGRAKGLEQKALEAKKS
ncbi:MAG: flotillin family protein [Planctomycetota bacterium]|nr:flotillin family protein [Planctomycetota bacterium]